MEIPGASKRAVHMTKPLVRPIQHLLFNFLKSESVVQIWLYENTDIRFEGRIIGFDEYMNLVLDNAVELSAKRQTRRPLGRILLKGDNLALVRNA